MNRRLIIPAFILIVLSLLLGIGLTSMTLPQQAAAQTDNQEARTIQVTGQGEVSAEPDQAIVRMGVETEADTAESALDDNNDWMTAVISATLDAGIAEEDIQTQGFNLRPIYDTPDGGQPELSGYRVSNIVRVTVHDLTMLGQLLDATVAAGSNSIEGIQFEVSNQGYGAQASESLRPY